MKCPRCQAENSAGMRFCGQCAAPLTAACPSCGAVNPPENKFCGQCATPLGRPAEPRFGSPEAYTPKHLAEKILTSKTALEGERKQLTVLFADMKGSMELLADRDPEEARKLLDPVLELMMEAVHRYEGTVNQVMGDGIMALFGAPLAHEDHAVRACYAALRMQETMKRYADEVRRAQGVSPEIRVGLNSGEVVVRAIGNDLRMDYTAVGQTAHLAARMEQLADPGSILLTANTLRLTEGYVELKPLGTVPVRGLAEPVQVYELAGAGRARRRFEAVAIRGLTRFVGRAAELDHLRRALEWAGAGHGQVVAVVGEPGVGKSRLFWEFTHSHRTQDWLILESGSVSYGKATPYLPVIDLFKAYFQLDPRDDARNIREKVTGKLFALDRALEPWLPAVLALLEVPVEDNQWQALEPPLRRQRVLEAVKCLLLRQSQLQPLVVVFEDLHWIDSETQAVLDTLVESLPTARILLLANYRREYQHSWGSKIYFSQLRIDPLLPETAEELLEALLGADSTLAQLKRLLIQQTEGNPFFLEESVRTLVETKVLAGDRGTYRLAKPVEGIQVPATVQAVLAARIDRLPAEDKHLLQMASVVGKDVSLPILQAVADLLEPAVRERLAHLQAAEFLHEASVSPVAEYTFKHALTHEVTYRSLLEDQRRALHRRVAEAVERLAPDMSERQPEVLARHLTHADLPKQAIGYWHRAGERAIQRSANVEAIAHLTTGLTLVDTLPLTAERMQQELTLQVSLGTALVMSKGYGAPDVERVMARARELCEALSDSPQLFPVLFGLWRFYVARADFPTAQALASQLLAVAQRRPGPALLVPAHLAAGVPLFYRGEFVRAREHLEQAFTEYRREDTAPHALLYGQDLGVGALAFLAWTTALLGYRDRAAETAHCAVTLAREVAHPFSVALALHLACMVHHLRGEPRLAGELGREELAISREHGFPFFIAGGLGFTGWALTAEGRTEEGLARMREGARAYRATGAEVGLAHLTHLTEALVDAGHVDEALGVLGDALARAQKTGERAYQAELHRIKGEALLRQAVPEPGLAAACFCDAIAVAREQSARSLQLRTALSLTRLPQGQAAGDDARATLEHLCAWFTEGWELPDQRAAWTLLAEPPPAPRHPDRP